MNTDDHNNRHRKSLSGDGNNPPWLAHENAFLISENADVGEVNRSRKSSAAGSTSSGSLSGTAFHWLQQSALASIVPRLLESRHLSPEPPGEAPNVRRPSSGRATIDGCKAPGKLLQSFPRAVGQVRRRQPVRPPFNGNRSAQGDPFREANKQLFSHRSNGSQGRDALDNGNFLGCLWDLPPGVLMVTLETAK